METETSFVDWTRTDIGSGEVVKVRTAVIERPFEVVIPVEIPLKAYQRLVNWASIGRTINGLLSDDELERGIAQDELQDLSTALCKIHDAIRSNHIQQQLGNR